MASHKTLASVVRSTAESFTSLMNFSQDDYVLGHIVQAAWATGGDRLRLDLVSSHIDPSPLAIPLVEASLCGYAAGFPDLVERSNSSMSFVASAELLVTVDPSDRRSLHNVPQLYDSPYSCVVSLTDDRGVLFEHCVAGRWYSENPPGIGAAAREAAVRPGA